jgi:hypothetical protein
MFDLGGADPEGQRPEGSVCRRVGVTANDGHAGLSDSLLGSDDVHDSLTGIVETEEGDSEFGTIGDERVYLLLRQGVGDPELAAGGRDSVIDGGQGQIGPPDLPSGQAQSIEGLGRGDLMNQVKVDIEKVGLTR